MRDEAQEWLESAREDLDTARYNFDGDRLRYAAFLCQQSVEKALKAAHIDAHGENLASHNLVHLARELDAPESIVDASAELNQLYVETRYPDSFVEYTESDVETFLTLAAEVVAWTEPR